MLRDFLLLIIAAGGFLYGLKLMGMLDSFLAQQHDKKERTEEKVREYAVIFGSREEPELKQWFESAGFEVLFIDEIQMQKEWKDVRYVVALGESDVDNLSLCSLFRKTCPKAELYSICNERTVRKLYRQAGAISFFSRDDLMQRMELITLGHEAGAA